MNGYAYGQQYMEALKRLHGGGKQQTDLDADTLLQAIREQPDPPCNACAFSHECKTPDGCTPYLAYIETGEAVRSPLPCLDGPSGPLARCLTVRGEGARS